MPFYKALSMIVLEETTRGKKVETITNNYVFLTSQDDNFVDNTNGKNNHGGCGNAPLNRNKGNRRGVVEVDHKINSGNHFSHKNTNRSFHHVLHHGNLGPCPCVHTQQRQIGMISLFLIASQ